MLSIQSRAVCVIEKTDYLARFGVRLAEAGYDVVPIKPGQKFPAMDGWQKADASPATVRKWIANGHAHDGVGIRTARTPGVDIDVTDPAIADAMEAWCQATLGFAPVRTGNAPKRLLLYRTDTPFKKVQSAWHDPRNPLKPQKLEVLGDGQQFVALAVHPDTHKPYSWSADNILKTPPANLEAITVDDAHRAVAEFDRLAAAAGWTRVASGLAPLAGQPVAASDDMWATVQPDVEISDDELRRYLMAMAGHEDYEGWLHAGMALHAHYRGSGDGLALWHEWSAQSGKYDSGVCDAKWETFKTSDGRPTKTARYIIKAGKEALAAQGKDVLRDVKLSLAQAASQKDIEKAAFAASSVALGVLDRESLIILVRDAWKRLTGAALPVGTARQLIKHRPPTDDGKPVRPHWLSGWVYLTHDDTFYLTTTGDSVSRAGFDAKFDRYMLTAAEIEAGKTVPETHASDAALNQHKVRTVVNRLYLPGAEVDFVLNGLAYVNAYRANLLPDVPEKISARDQRNVETVEAHFRLLYPNDRERALLLSALAYIVQTGQRINWAILLQGTEGDGKSWLLTLLGAVLGANNVKTVAAKTLEGQFNGWAEGSQVTVVEEVKLQGHNKFDVLNSIKPLITNSWIEIHRKGRDPYGAPNTTFYLLLTNYADALPLTENDSRYLVLNSFFQTKQALEAYMATRPDYYQKLFDAVDQSPGALRKWLLDMPLHEDFKPLGRAPWSRGRDYMAKMSASDEHEAVVAALAGHPGDLLDHDALLGAVEEDGGHVIHLWQMKRILGGLGWFFLGVFTIGGRRRRLWSQTPALWEVSPGVYDKARIEERLKD